MKVITSCRSRYWIYDQAVQLLRRGLLYRLIHDYPNFMTRRWGIPDDKVVSLLANGLYARLLQSNYRWMSPPIKAFADRSIHELFETRLSRALPDGADIFIGLSAFSLKAIERAKALGLKTVVDHGSLHHRRERTLQQEERALWQLEGAGHFPIEGPGPAAGEWLIEKEHQEFLLADRVFALSSIAKRSMVAEGIPAEKILVNPPGVDLSSFRPGTKTDDVFRVIQCGTVHPGKGVQYLLKAFYELHLPRAELWFVGGGLDTTSLGPVMRQYRRDDIVFKGPYPQKELPGLFAQGSVAVMASVFDGYGMVVPQAMACGLPVIVTEQVGASDLVEDGVNGQVVPIRDVDALKERLVYLYEHRDHARALGQAAERTVRSGHTWDDYGDRLVAHLRALAPH
ncbi:MAG: glycosyltransferase family 4 protein [Deltaproteobacteria bacterium]|nr:glycosyltransferase family 4 protein [Deltaproteobacteria bacterium]